MTFIATERPRVPRPALRELVDRQVVETAHERLETTGSFSVLKTHVRLSSEDMSRIFEKISDEDLLKEIITKDNSLEPRLFAATRLRQLRK